MDHKPRPADAVSDPTLGNANLTDSQVADVLVSGFPLELRMLLGPDMREIITFAIARERSRAASVATQVARLQASKARGAAPAAQMNEFSARSILAVARMIQAPPGACGRCGGASQVPSGLSGPGGQPLMVACPACGSAPESVDASVSEISDAKPSDT